MRDLAKLLNKSIVITDLRTGVSYQTKILEAKAPFGNLMVKVSEDGRWFVPTEEELNSAKTGGKS